MPPTMAPPVPSTGQDWGLRTMGGVDLASLPAPSMGFGLSGVLNLSDNRLELFAAGFLPQSATLAVRPYAGADVWLAEGGIRYCRMLGIGSVELGGCGGAEIGLMTASSFGVQTSGSGSSLWIAVELGLLGVYHLSPRFGLGLDLTGLAPVIRQPFQITGLGEVYRPPALSGRIGLGVEVHFR